MKRRQLYGTRLTAMLLALTLLRGLLAGCGGQVQQQPPPAQTEQQDSSAQPEQPEQQEPETVTVTDIAGRTVSSATI